MVRLEHVNKYFNRKKKNEIHVINDTSLSMEDKGLIALLGPSGCGKTTLLNVIGGLDKVGSGHVYINGQRITKRRTGKIDQIRNLNIGYVFQNYNLVDNMTVFDNVAIALKMVGVRDKKEIEEKVNYVLEKVGMYRYRNRYADMLSGGERQRVGIARAIVKDPAIVIADEPTGNLDSKNTLEVMNIIKAISQDRLVILVTHEEELADFYASRVIRIKDGAVVSDCVNAHGDQLDYRVDNKIYLKDIKDHKRLKTESYHIDFYNDSGGRLDLVIVIRNGNIYIENRAQDSRVEVVDDNSSVELTDDHYRRITKEEYLASGFDTEKLRAQGKRKYRSILNPLSMIRQGFKTVFNYNVLKKILLLGFLISAMFITYAVSNIFGVLNITDDEFITADKSYIRVVDKNPEVAEYLAYEQNGEYEYIMPGNGSLSVDMKFDDYFQTQQNSAVITGSLSDSGKLSEKDIVSGRLPENSSEIVIDRLTLENVIEEQGTKMAGFGRPSDFVGETVSVNNMPDMTIVGIADRESPCIYTDRSLFINLLANSREEGEYEEGYGGGGGSEASAEFIDYTLKQSQVTLERGSWPTGDYQVLVNEKNREDMPVGRTISQKINGTNLTVTGYYSDAYDSDFMLVSSNTIKYNLINSKDNITICPKNKASALRQLEEQNVNAVDVYAEAEKEYKDGMWSSIFSTVVMAGVILLISFIEIFLMIRASFLSRVKEVGVYRAIGVKKGDIYRMFMGEILAITTMSSMPGFVFMAYILYKLSGISYFSQLFLVNVPVLILCIGLIYGFNLLFGLFPVFRTIRKTPAAILSRTDIN